MIQKTAVMAGASGLVGGQLLKLLLAEPQYYQIISIGRRKLPIEHAKLTQLISEFKTAELASLVTEEADYFCCLGTTIKKAGSKAAFRKVDLEYPLALAQHAATQRACSFFVVTALGADPESMIFYNKVKGELESKLKELPLFSLNIFRPSLLMGERTEQRTGEQIAQKVLPLFTPLLFGPLRKYRPIKATTVAKALLISAANHLPGIHVFDSNEIEALAKA